MDSSPRRENVVSPGPFLGHAQGYTIPCLHGCLHFEVVCARELHFDVLEDVLDKVVSLDYVVTIATRAHGHDDDKNNQPNYAAR